MSRALHDLARCPPATQVTPVPRQARLRSPTAAALVRTDRRGSRAEPAAGVTMELLNSPNHILRQASSGTLRLMLSTKVKSRLDPHPSPAWISSTTWANPTELHLDLLRYGTRDTHRMPVLPQKHMEVFLSVSLSFPQQFLALTSQ